MSAFTQCPLRRSQIDAGPQTNADPNTGNNVASAVTTAQRIRAESPKNQKETPARMPCAAPTAIPPYRLAIKVSPIPVKRLGKLCQTLAEQDVNIIAYQQFPHEKGKGSVRLVVDNPDKTKTTLDRQSADYSETEVAKVMLTNRPGELARVASRLGDQGININYGYCGAEPSASASFLILGVGEAGKVVKLLEQAAAAGGKA
jgi:hypothetical protein